MHRLVRLLRARTRPGPSKEEEGSLLAWPDMPANKKTEGPSSFNKRDLCDGEKSKPDDVALNLLLVGGYVTMKKI